MVCWRLGTSSGRLMIGEWGPCRWGRRRERPPSHHRFHASRPPPPTSGRASFYSTLQACLGTAKQPSLGRNCLNWRALAGWAGWQVPRPWPQA